MRSVLMLCLIPALVGCSNDAIKADAELDGNWVETLSRTDTITFEKLDSSDSFNLNRGVEVLDGMSKPKYRSGTYLYTLGDGNISLKWLLSSNSAYEEYYFRLKGNRLRVGNFYDAPSGAILEFEKLE